MSQNTWQLAGVRRKKLQVFPTTISNPNSRSMYCQPVSVKFTYTSPYFIFEERLENCKHCIEVEWLIDHIESFEPQGKCLLETI
jgi:hypothetical protein